MVNVTTLRCGGNDEEWSKWGHFRESNESKEGNLGLGESCEGITFVIKK